MSSNSPSSADSGAGTSLTPPAPQADVAQTPRPHCSLSPLVNLWVTRILVPLGGARRFVRGSDFSCDPLAVALGFSLEEVDAPPSQFNARKAQAKIQQFHLEAEQDAKRNPPVHSTVMEENLDRFQSLLGLSQAEREVLRFALIIQHESSLEQASDLLGRFSTAMLHFTLAAILDLPAAQLREALAAESKLARSGLLTIDHDDTSIGRKLQILHQKFSARMLHHRGEPLEMLKGIINNCPSPELTRADYAHLEQDLAVLCAYLGAATNKLKPGVNILFHGPPGTGKTQLARLIAAELRVPLYEVTSEDQDGDPASGPNRVNAFRMTQTILRDRPALVVFDEIEDVFGSARMGATIFGFRLHREARRGADTSKAWINRMLEQNPAPTIWITNSISEVDPAYIRRFDYVLRVGQPPREAREALLFRTCGNLLPEPTLRRLSAHPNLSPAIITRAAQVLGEIQGTRPAEALQEDLVRMVDQTLQAQGHSAVASLAEQSLPAHYDPRFIHTSEDPEQILAGICRTGSARLCLYGAPGTGKTAFGRYVADRLKRRLSIVRASEILGRYVGETEANLSEAFNQARSSKAVLLIDEVDSFLQDRSRAQRSWEVTAVNEMLTQMESFPGVFIASTNLMNDLDPAALRRFDLKLRFLPLRSEQAADLLALHLAAAGLPPATHEDLRQLARLSSLTPGDYAAVERRHRFAPLPDAAAFVRALAAECAAKAPAARAPIGFGVSSSPSATPRLEKREVAARPCEH